MQIVGAITPSSPFDKRSSSRSWLKMQVPGERGSIGSFGNGAIECENDKEKGPRKRKPPRRRRRGKIPSRRRRRTAAGSPQ